MPRRSRVMAKSDIGAVEFWNDPQDNPGVGEDARYLRSHVLELPIHQGVTPSQVEYIARQVLRLKLEPGAMLTCTRERHRDSIAAHLGTSQRTGMHFRWLRQESDELVEASESACVFVTWESLYTWWKHLAGNQSLTILTVRRGSELVAIAPFCRPPASPSSARPFSVLEFPGSGFTGSDYLDVIVRKGNDREASQAWWEVPGLDSNRALSELHHELPG